MSFLKSKPTDDPGHGDMHHDYNAGGQEGRRPQAHRLCCCFYRCWMRRSLPALGGADLVPLCTRKF